MTTTHLCPVNGCHRRVRHSHLMCPTHWARVPRGLQDTVWRTFRREPLGKLHLAAMRAAIDAVNDSLESPRAVHREYREARVDNDRCPECGGELDTGWECNDCGFDAKPIKETSP